MKNPKLLGQKPADPDSKQRSDQDARHRTENDLTLQALHRREGKLTAQHQKHKGRRDFGNALHHGKQYARLLRQQKDLLAVRPHGNQTAKRQAQHARRNSDNQRIFHNIQSDLFPIDCQKSAFPFLFLSAKYRQRDHGENIEQRNGKRRDDRYALHRRRSSQGLGQRNTHYRAIGTKDTL